MPKTSLVGFGEDVEEFEDESERPRRLSALDRELLDSSELASQSSAPTVESNGEVSTKKLSAKTAIEGVPKTLQSLHDELYDHFMEWNLETPADLDSDVVRLKNGIAKLKMWLARPSRPPHTAAPKRNKEIMESHLFKSAATHYEKVRKNKAAMDSLWKGRAKPMAMTQIVHQPAPRVAKEKEMTDDEMLKKAIELSIEEVNLVNWKENKALLESQLESYKVALATSEADLVESQQALASERKMAEKLISDLEVSKSEINDIYLMHQGVCSELEAKVRSAQNEIEEWKEKARMKKRSSRDRSPQDLSSPDVSDSESAPPKTKRPKGLSDADILDMVTSTIELVSDHERQLRALTRLHGDILANKCD